MKAPDKLYISKNIYGTFMYQVPNPDDENKVEYVRADAFIGEAEEKAEEYSFNIESQLFPLLNAEQQKLWKAEIEQAYMAGAEVKTQDQIDALRLEYEKGRADVLANPTGGELLYVLNKGVKQGYKDAVSKSMNFLWDSGYIDTLAIEEVIDKYKKYMEEQQ